MHCVYGIQYCLRAAVQYAVDANARASSNEYYVLNDNRINIG
jgi:hypothetical protein